MQLVVQRTCLEVFLILLFNEYFGNYTEMGIKISRFFKAKMSSAQTLEADICDYHFHIVVKGWELG